jgi:hypothetical protein
MIEVPVAFVTALTNPVETFTVATLGVAEVQAPPVFPSDVKLVVALEQMACVPLKIPAFGAVVMVTVRVADAFAHPPVPVTV